MSGEQLQSAVLTPLGITGDRVVHVRNERGRIITSRTHPRLLGHHATLGPSGEPNVDGVLWTDPHVLDEVVQIAGPGAQLIRDDSEHRFDILPLLVATDGAIAAFGHDGRRLRPNLIIGGVEGLAERTWPGRCLRIGNLSIGIQDLRGRCVMTTYDPDTLEQDHKVLKEIVQKFDGVLALNCYIIRGGEIQVGDTVELAKVHECEGVRARET
jgi:uncharacterized protein YcbX